MIQFLSRRMRALLLGLALVLPLTLSTAGLAADQNPGIGSGPTTAQMTTSRMVYGMRRCRSRSSTNT